MSQDCLHLVVIVVTRNFTAPSSSTASVLIETSLKLGNILSIVISAGVFLNRKLVVRWNPDPVLGPAGGITVTVTDAVQNYVSFWHRTPGLAPVHKQWPRTRPPANPMLIILVTLVLLQVNITA